jgi:hypothetical protein
MSRRFEQLLPGTLDYHIRFLSEKNKPNVMMEVNLKTLSGFVSTIETAIINEFGSIDYYPDITEIIANIKNAISDYKNKLSNKIKVGEKREISGKLEMFFSELREELRSIPEK